MCVVSSRSRGEAEGDHVNIHLDFDLDFDLDSACPCGHIGPHSDAVFVDRSRIRNL